MGICRNSIAGNQSSKALAGYAEVQGFKVTRGVAEFPTEKRKGTEVWKAILPEGPPPVK